MKYYTVINRNELERYATTWMNFKNLMLSENRQKKLYGA